MASDLQELKDRIEWARQSTIVLGAQIDGFLKDSAYSLEEKYDAESGYTELFVVKQKDPPRPLRIQAGVIIHELRATLDSLACQLAVRHYGGCKDTYFPISANRTVFETEGKRKIRKLSDADQATIVALEPYSEGNSLLFALHKADLIRKHQRLIMTGSNAGTARMFAHTVSEFEGGMGGLVNDRLSLARYRGENSFHLDVTVGLCFSEPDIIAQRPISPTLRDFTRLVEDIVNLFD